MGNEERPDESSMLEGYVRTLVGGSGRELSAHPLIQAD
jgi:hypothetical protein